MGVADVFGLSGRHHRPRLATPEQVSAWLRVWNNGHLIPTGAEPVQPWKRTPERDLLTLGDALLKERARFDAEGRKP
jgi:hypothetical protein